MDNKLLSLLLILLGVIIFYITYKDNKTRKANLTTSYIMHLKGFIGDFFLMIIGIIIMNK
jgi:uncharacterized membrane protein